LAAQKVRATGEEKEPPMVVPWELAWATGSARTSEEALE